MYKLVFCGYVKGFDVIHREISWFKMRQEGISDNVAYCIKCMPGMIKVNSRESSGYSRF
jgi:hypothetical protein